MGAVPESDGTIILFKAACMLKQSKKIHALIHLSGLLLLVPLLSSCAPQPTIAPTATSLPTSTASPVPSETPLPTATAIRTPPALPAVFQSGELNPLDTPHTYIADTCQYLKDKWTSTNSAPGTVLMPIMFHSIAKEGETNANQVSLKDFEILMRDLKSQEFEAITMQQAADFLKPQREDPCPFGPADRRRPALCAIFQ